MRIAVSPSAQVRRLGIGRQVGEPILGGCVGIPASYLLFRQALRTQASALPEPSTTPCPATASELTTNAERYATESPSITVELHLDDVLRLAVRDAANGLPILRPPVHDTDENGRGLRLVAALCSDWGTALHEDGTKTVWASFRLPRSPFI